MIRLPVRRLSLPRPQAAGAVRTETTLTQLLKLVGAIALADEQDADGRPRPAERGAAGRGRPMAHGMVTLVARWPVARGTVQLTVIQPESTPAGPWR